jgi:predicted TIM-barrel fold metal-dependent hydrolase
MAAGGPRALIDWHTHVWLPEHLGAEHEAEMAARTGRSTTATPEQHRAAVEGADKFVVIGIRWGRLGANVPNDFTAKYVAQYPGRAAGSVPRLRIIVAHLGQPWVEETVQLLRKHKTMFADLSARYYRRWQFYNAMQAALDYQVTGQLLFGSDFPMQTTAQAVAAFRAMNDFGPGVSLPRVPEAVIESILHERPFELLGL